jgi:midasin
LDDQIDSKVLIGSEVCTETPGVFKWQPGALTQAVTKGCWVVLEDIDQAPFEVLSALTSLLERRELFIQGKGKTIRANYGFQLFASLLSGHSFSQRRGGRRRYAD